MDKVPCPGCHEGMDFGLELCPKCREKALREAKKGPEPAPRVTSGGCLIPVLFLIAAAAVGWAQRGRIKAYIEGLKKETTQTKQQFGGKVPAIPAPAEGDAPPEEPAPEQP